MAEERMVPPQQDLTEWRRSQERLWSGARKESERRRGFLWAIVAALLYLLAQLTGLCPPVFT